MIKTTRSFMEKMAHRQRRAYLVHLDQDKEQKPISDLKASNAMIKALRDYYWPDNRPKNFNVAYAQIFINDPLMMSSLKPLMNFLELQTDTNDLVVFGNEIVQLRNQLKDIDLQEYKIILILNGMETILT